MLEYKNVGQLARTHTCKHREEEQERCEQVWKKEWVVRVLVCVHNSHQTDWTRTLIAKAYALLCVLFLLFFMENYIFFLKRGALIQSPHWNNINSYRYNHRCTEESHHIHSPNQKRIDCPQARLRPVYKANQRKRRLYLFVSSTKMIIIITLLLLFFDVFQQLLLLWLWLWLAF